MRSALSWIGAACLVCILGLAVMVLAGLYSFAADEPHFAPVESSIGWARQRSIAAHLDREKVVLPTDQASLRNGAQHYAEMCVGCHMAPDGGSRELHDALYPVPPDLTRKRVDPEVAFWTIKHGVKMTGMPAWGRSHDDATLLAIDAFVQKLPGMAAQDYRTLLGEEAKPSEPQSAQGHEHEHGHQHEHAAHEHSHGTGGS